MKIYLAAPFEKQLLMKAVAIGLRGKGFTVTSRWLEEDTDTPGSSDHAVRDIEDIHDADIVAVYNPIDFYRAGTGGRHVEFGYAIALGKAVILVGRPSNVFHRLDLIAQVGTIDELFEHLDGVRRLVVENVAVEIPKESIQAENDLSREPLVR